MTRPCRKYVLDTPLFITGFRDPVVNERLQDFHRAFSPFEYLSVIVAQELRAGVTRAQDRRSLERNVLEIFTRAGRMIAPSAGAWHQLGDMLAEMARQEGLEIPRVSKAFGNDILLALSCRESGCVLVTDNAREFQQIRRFVRFEFIAPWPTRADARS